MFRLAVVSFVLCLVLAARADDGCPGPNEKLGTIEKFCDEKWDVKLKKTCVCKWFYYKDDKGNCVKESDCDKTSPPTTTEKGKPDCDKPDKESCPKGYYLAEVPCKRHNGGKVCKVCKPYGGGYYPHDGHHGRK